MPQACGNKKHWQSQWHPNAEKYVGWPMLVVTTLTS
jgi:hypothetical protein